MRFLYYGILLIVILIGISFACLNAEPVLINYYIGQAKSPLSFLLAITFGSGVFLGLLAGLSKCLSLKRENMKLSHRIKLAEKELASLRTMPTKNL